MSHSILRCVTAAALFAACFAFRASAQDLNIYERVLVPISVGQVPGAYGSIWSTEMYYRNNSGHSVAIFPVAISDWGAGVGVTEFLPIGNLPASAPGQILFLSRDGGDKVQFDLRLFNRAAPQASWGTKLPVVREQQFTKSVDLINVPTASDFRIALRVYGLPDDTFVGETLDVRIYSHSQPERLLASTELTFVGWPRYTSILSLGDEFPQIRQVDRVRVHVEPQMDQSKIWAFISVTSNATQQISVVTPD